MLYWTGSIPARAVTCRRRPSDPFGSTTSVRRRKARPVVLSVLYVSSGSRRLHCSSSRQNCVDHTSLDHVRRQKRKIFWRDKVEAETRDPHQLWRSVNALLGRGRVPLCDATSAVSVHQFFDAKVDGMVWYTRV